MTFKLIPSKRLGDAIAGHGKVVASYKAKEHQLAASCIAHRRDHNCVEHLNKLLSVTPGNYRLGLIKWAVAFGAVDFDSKARVFTLPKGKKALNMESVMTIAPADYEKATTGKTDAKPFDEVAYLTKALKRLQDEGASARAIRGVEGILKALALPQQEEPAKVVKPADKGAPKAKAARTAAPVASVTKAPKAKVTAPEAVAA